MQVCGELEEFKTLPSQNNISSCQLENNSFKFNSFPAASKSPQSPQSLFVTTRISWNANGLANCVSSFLAGTLCHPVDISFYRGGLVLQLVSELVYSFCSDWDCWTDPGRFMWNRSACNNRAQICWSRCWPAEMRCYGVTPMSLNATTQLTKLAGSGTKSPISRNYLWDFGKDLGAFSLNLPRK